MKIILHVIITVWVFLWVGFGAREILFKGLLKDYIILLGRDLDGKRSYVTGDDLYRFISLCQARLPSGSSYELVGVEDGSLEKRRAVYYLYPAIEKKPADYILVFKKDGYAIDGYRVDLSVDDSSFILRKAI